MNAWRTVLKLEWRILGRDRASAMMLVAFAVAVVIAAAAGGRLAQGTRAAQQKAVSDHQARYEATRKALDVAAASNEPLAASDPRDPLWMGEEGAAQLIVLPPNPLGAIAVGQRSLRPQSFAVSTAAHLVSERETESAIVGPTRLLSGAFDPAFVFVVLFPLLVIALSYELLSGERERGTLAMLLSQPVSQRDLVGGKAAARAVLVCVSALVLAAIGLIVGGADLGQPNAWLHAALYAAVVVSWALVWFAASVFVNARGGTSERNALVLVGGWLVFVVVLPGLVHAAIDSVVPPPSRMELVHETREAADEMERKLAGLRGRHDRNTKTRKYASELIEVKEALAKRAAPVVEEMQVALDRRAGLLDNLRFSSPALIVQVALEDIAGSGSTRHRIFEKQVDAHHRVFQKHFFALARSGKRFAPANTPSIPGFAFEDQPVSELVTRVAIGVFVLLLLAGLLLAGAWPALRRVGRLTR